MVGIRPTESVITGSGWSRRPSQGEVETLVRTLVGWAGDDPDREGLSGTPERVVRAWEDFYAGYNEDLAALLATTFEETTADDLGSFRDDRTMRRQCLPTIASHRSAQNES